MQSAIKSVLCAAVFAFSWSSYAQIFPSDIVGIEYLRVAPAQAIVVINLPAPLTGTQLSCGTNDAFSLNLATPGHAELYALVLSAKVNNRNIQLWFETTDECATLYAVPASISIW